MKAVYLPLPLRKTCSESWEPLLSKGEELEKQVKLAPSKSMHALAKREGTSGLAWGEWWRHTLESGAGRARVEEALFDGGGRLAVARDERDE